MNNETEDLKSLYISNLNTIRGLNNRVEQLELEKNNLSISSINTIKELNVRVEQLESEKNNQFLQLATGLITVMDTFEKLKQAISKKILNKSNKGKKVIKRYKKVGRSLEALLLQFEITKITFPDKKLINGFYKVVGTEPDASQPEDTILSIVKNGYIRGSELIREAEVIVVKNYQDDQTEISNPVLNHIT
jgi:molecular chaperone GrpE (heat shock protein)